MANSDSEQTLGVQYLVHIRRESGERRRRRAAEHSPVPFKVSPLSPGGFSLCGSQNANGSKVKMFKGFKNLCVRFGQARRRCCFSLHSHTRSRSQPEQPPQPLVLFELGHMLWGSRLEQTRGRKSMVPRDAQPCVHPACPKRLGELELRSPLLPQIITPRARGREYSPQSQVLIHHQFVHTDAKDLESHGYSQALRLSLLQQGKRK